MRDELVAWWREALRQVDRFDDDAIGTPLADRVERSDAVCDEALDRVGPPPTTVETPFAIGEAVEAELFFGKWSPAAIDYVKHVEGDVWAIGVAHKIGGYSALLWPDRRVRKLPSEREVAVAQAAYDEGWRDHQRGYPDGCSDDHAADIVARVRRATS